MQSRHSASSKPAPKTPHIMYDPVGVSIHHLGLPLNSLVLTIMDLARMVFIASYSENHHNVHVVSGRRRRASAKTAQRHRHHYGPILGHIIRGQKFRGASGVWGNQLSILKRPKFKTLSYNSLYGGNTLSSYRLKIVSLHSWRKKGQMQSTFLQNTTIYTNW